MPRCLTGAVRVSEILHLDRQFQAHEIKFSNTTETLTAQKYPTVNTSLFRHRWEQSSLGFSLSHCKGKKKIKLPWQQERKLLFSLTDYQPGSLTCLVYKATVARYIWVGLFFLAWSSATNRTLIFDPLKKKYLRRIKDANLNCALL